MVEVMKIMGTSFKRSSAESLGHSQESLGQSLWGHCSFLLGPGAHKLLFVPSKSLFPQSTVSSGSSLSGVNGDLLQEGLCHTQVCGTQSPAPAAGHR